MSFDKHFKIPLLAIFACLKTYGLRCNSILIKSKSVRNHFIGVCRVHLASFPELNISSLWGLQLQCNQDYSKVDLWPVFSEPVATSWSSGFQMWVGLPSTRVGRARRFRPRRFPRCVANSRPPAPPPTTTILCRVDCIFATNLAMFLQSILWKIRERI